jgi:hypothetical protein
MLYVQLEFCTIDLSVLVLFLMIVSWASMSNKVNKTNFFYTPLSSLMDSTMNPKVKITEGEGIGARFLACSISGVEGRVGAPGWELGRLTRNSITHMDLHKPNNKLVSA